MNYSQKNVLVSFIATLLISIPYLAYISTLDPTNSLDASNELEFISRALLLLIGIRIVAQIIIFIVFSIVEAIITKENTIDETTDERDELIELKAQKHAMNVFTFTIFVALSILALGFDPKLSVQTFILGGFVSELTWYGFTFYSYRK